jgi:hypothetical protein
MDGTVRGDRSGHYSRHDDEKGNNLIIFVFVIHNYSFLLHLLAEFVDPHAKVTVETSRRRPHCYIPPFFSG